MRYRKIVLKNTHYVDTVQETLRSNVDIVIKGDSIEAIVSPQDTYRDDFILLNCQNMYAVPGLFESHAHLGGLSQFDEEEQETILAKFVEKGITQLRDVGSPLKIMHQMKSAISSGKLKGPEIFYAGPMLERSPLTWAAHNDALPGFTVSIDSQEEVDSILDELMKYNASLVKTFSKFDKDVFVYLVREAQKRGLPVTHDPGAPLFHAIPMDRAIDFGVRCIEHGKAPWPMVLKDELQQEHDAAMRETREQRRKVANKIFSLKEEAIDFDKLDRLAEKMLASQTYLCPTLTVAENIPDDASEEMCFMLNLLDEMSQLFVAQLIEKGVKMLVGVDSCFPKLANEMMCLDDVGLSTMEIIKGATLYPAQWLQVADQFGSIECGKKANIMVVSENPLHDIGNLQNVTRVLKNGIIAYQA